MCYIRIFNFWKNGLLPFSSGNIDCTPICTYFFKLRTITLNVKEANMSRVNLNGCISWPNSCVELKIEPHIPWSLVHYVLYFFYSSDHIFPTKTQIHRNTPMAIFPTCRTQEGNMAYGVLCVKWYWKWQHNEKMENV